MTVAQSDIDFALELFDGIGTLSARKMTGACCLYADGQIFAVLGDGRIWLRARGDLGTALARAGSQQATITRKDGSTATNCCWTLPEPALDDPALARDWARRSLAASRAEAQKGAQRKRGNMA